MFKHDHDNDAVNRSGNRPFEDVLRASLSRRNLLKRSAVLSAAGFAATYVGNNAFAEPAVAKGKQPGDGRRSLINFTPVTLADAAAGDAKTPLISPDYEYQVLIPWGTPIDPNSGIKEYTGDPNTRPTSAEQAQMIGIGHDGMWYFPIEDRFGRGQNRQGVLCLNHEYGGNTHVLGKSFPETLEDVRLSQHAHGVSVVEIKFDRGRWDLVSSSKSRRIHVNTPVTFDGPVAGSSFISTPSGNSPKGTVNNCANGYTPWGTYLTCEENFNGYFGYTDPSYQLTEAQVRYGFSANGFGYGWHLFDPRFDLSNPSYKNEENRFGWVVEIDPMDASQTPVKYTALGRFKHEGIAVIEGQDGRIVGYMGDDERFNYIYKFVSSGNWRSMRAAGKSPFSEGKLYAAKFNDDNTGEWLELTINNPVLAAKFSSQAEVLTYARLAADALGATPMDRPEWTTVTPDGYTYCTLTNNSRRTVADAANPLAPNPDGHIIRWKDSNNFVGTTFVWDIFVIAQTTHGTEASFSSPDGLWADSYGRLFIQTDGDQKDGLQDQLLVADTNTGEIRRLFMGVSGNEITGLTITPDQRTLFCNTQHPGNGDPALTNFPAPTDGVTIPRDCTFVIRRKNGITVGS